MRMIFHNLALRAVLRLFVGEYAESPKGLKVGDRVKVDVDVQRLEELQRLRDAWDPELAKVSSKHARIPLRTDFTDIRTALHLFSLFQFFSSSQLSFFLPF